MNVWRIEDIGSIWFPEMPSVDVCSNFFQRKKERKNTVYYLGVSTPDTFVVWLFTRVTESMKSNLPAGVLANAS